MQTNCNRLPMRVGMPGKSRRQHYIDSTVPRVDNLYRAKEEPVPVSEHGELKALTTIFFWAFSTLLMYPVWSAVVPALGRWLDAIGW